MDPDRARQLLARERQRIEQAIARLGSGGLGGRGRGGADTSATADPPVTGEPSEPGDWGSEDLYQSEFDAGLAEDLAEQLAALERAEARLDAGVYGLSVQSGEPIPDKRLETLPTAELTVEEQQLRERR